MMDARKLLDAALSDLLRIRQFLLHPTTSGSGSIDNTANLYAAYQIGETIAHVAFALDILKEDKEEQA